MDQALAVPFFTMGTAQGGMPMVPLPLGQLGAQVCIAQKPPRFLQFQVTSFADDARGHVAYRLRQHPVL